MGHDLGGRSPGPGASGASVCQDWGMAEPVDAQIDIAAAPSTLYSMVSDASIPQS